MTHSTSDADVRESWSFEIYTSIDAPFSSLALANLRTLCEAYLPGRHRIREVNVDLRPEAGRERGLERVPAVVRLSPGPVLTTYDCRHLGILRRVLEIDTASTCVR